METSFLFSFSAFAVAGIAFLFISCLTVFLYFWLRKSLEGVSRGVSSLAELESRRTLLEEENRQREEELTAKRNELLALDAERKEQENVRLKLGQLVEQCRHMEAEAKEIERRIEEAKRLEGRQKELEERVEILKTEEQEFRARCQGLKSDLEGMEKRHEGLAASAQAMEHLQKHYEELQTNLVNKKNELISLQKEQERTRKELDALTPQLEKTRHEATITEETARRLREESARHGAEVAAFGAEKSGLETSLEQLKAELARIVRAHEEAKIAAREAEAARIEVQHARQQIAELNLQRANAEKEIQSLRSERITLTTLIAKARDELTKGAEDTESEDAYADLHTPVAALERTAFAGPRGEEQENTLLNRLARRLEADGYHFSPRVIRAFHTSLKCEDITPLTVLAGVSGTGKTLLPVKYAEFFGIHSLVIPVQPRWDSPQDLFGFYNYLEKRYKATDLARCLVRMDPYRQRKEYDWAQERMLLVLLDEMNLARTEYYFSEFLSKLELRRLVDGKNPDSRQKAEVALEGSGNAHRLWVPDNVLFVGTMNEDESTQTLSDKVLDRSNILRFGRPANRDMKNEKMSAPNDMPEERNALDARKPFLTYTLWEKWRRKPTQGTEMYDNCNRWMNQLNDGLDQVGRPFGYRVRDAMLSYVANYPDKNEWRLAFADQVEQKILPKLRGLEIDAPGTKGCLDEVAKVLRDLEDRPLEDAFEGATEEGRSGGLFMWRGVSRGEEA